MAYIKVSELVANAKTAAIDLLKNAEKNAIEAHNDTPIYTVNIAQEMQKVASILRTSSSKSSCVSVDDVKEYAAKLKGLLQ